MATSFALQDIHRLMPFVQAVRSGSFIAAAAQLQVTPPAVSKSIAKLEEELGVRLFNRTTRRLQLTPAGRVFSDSVNRALGELEQAVTVLREATHQPKGLVRVWVTATFGRYGLMPVIERFFERHPQVQLEICFEESPPSLVTEGFDVRIQHGRGQGTSQVSRLLCHYPIVLVASPAYLARHGTPQQPGDLAAHHCIAVHAGAAGASWTLLRAKAAGAEGTGLPERFSHTPRGPLAVMGQRDASLMAGLYGVGIVPSSELVVRPYLESGRLCHVLPEYRLYNATASSNSIYIQIPHRRHLPAKVRVLLDFLYEQFGDTSQNP
jgi:DNA-binding transcriptional LysR family regulator